ncbi:MAG TPA: plasmid pRiA4b ORF-3 family protein [Chloroflexota bacterium]|nr:plasmid pRiA4b ORF-3 family protein [Chloroflexota bacterium]
MANDRLCQRADDGRYVYLPAAVRGASVRIPLELTAPDKGLAVVPVEAFALLWPTASAWGEAGPAPRVALEGGPEIALEQEHRAWTSGLRVVLELPAPFWAWWAARRSAGADAVCLRCVDGEAGRYLGAALRTADLGAEAVAARNEQVRAAAVELLGRSRAGLRADDLAWRLLARGVYHADPTPDPLRVVLFDPPGAFAMSYDLIEHRPELTPAMRRLFAHRLTREQELDDFVVEQVIGRPAPMEPEPPAHPEVPRRRPTSGGEAPRAYRIKVALQWKPSVWRVVELGGGNTLEDLHYAIQDAFGWDDDHLYAFYLSGRPHDALTAVQRPFADAEPPTADEVRLNELELLPGQRFLYVFDFGDDLRHSIEVLEVVEGPASGDVPRIVESHGKAPAQYGCAEDETDD